MPKKKHSKARKSAQPRWEFDPDIPTHDFFERHKLWLQSCFNELSGLGDEEEMTLENPEEHYRIEWFIARPRERKESVAFLGLTLDLSLDRLILADKDKPIFVEMMREKLGLGSAQARIADYL